MDQLTTQEETNLNRKLAVIRKIDEVFSIEGADNIEGIKIGGWQVVVKKSDNFKPGTLCVYVEIDSVLPQTPEFEFMRQRHFRVKTVKLRKVISQGIVFPLSIIPSGFDCCELCKDQSKKMVCGCCCDCNCGCEGMMFEGLDVYKI